MEVEEEQQPPVETTPVIKQTDTTRCWSCKKKVNLLGIQCKCEFVFCNKHRMPEDHECSFDHAARGREQLVKLVPLVVKKKLEEI